MKILIVTVSGDMISCYLAQPFLLADDNVCITHI